MKNPKNTKRIIFTIFAIICFYVGNRLVETYNMTKTDSDSVFEINRRITETLYGFTETIRTKPIHIDITGNAIFGGLFFVLLPVTICLSMSLNSNMNYMPGIERG